MVQLEFLLVHCWRTSKVSSRLIPLYIQRVWNYSQYPRVNLVQTDFCGCKDLGSVCKHKQIGSGLFYFSFIKA